MKTANSFRHWVGRAWRVYRRDDRGAASSELVLCVWLLSFPAFWVTDFSYYVYQRMEAGYATQAGVQAIWAACTTPSMMPATLNCSGMATARDAAVQGTSLGTAVTVSSTTEDYYCVVKGALYGLVANGDMSSLNAKKPANCGANGIGGSNTDAPGDYVSVTTSFTFTPIFTGLSVVSLFGLPTTITQQAWTRIF